MRNDRLQKLWLHTALSTISCVTMFSTNLAYGEATLTEQGGVYRLKAELSDVTRTGYQTYKAQPGQVRLKTAKSLRYSSNYCTMGKYPIQYFEQNPTISNRYIVELVNTATACSFRMEDRPEARDDEYIIYVGTTHYSGGYTGFSVHLKGKPFVPPSTCKVITTPSLDFGTVHSTPASQTTPIRIECTGESSVTMSVNNGKPLIDKNSGTTISFPTGANGTSRITCKRSCVLNVTGVMNPKPNKPGKYQWSVPITISYD